MPTGLALPKGGVVCKGCIAEPLLVVEYNPVNLCILHCAMASRPMVMATENLRKEEVWEVQRILIEERTGVCLGSESNPNGDEVNGLLYAWEALALPLLIEIEKDICKTSAGMRDVARRHKGRSVRTTACNG